MLVRNTQFAAALEPTPGIAPALTGADVVETLGPAEHSSETEQIDEEPALGSMSPRANDVGASRATASLEVSMRGSGTPATAPQWAKFVLASLFSQITTSRLDLSVALTEPVKPGDVLEGGTSTAQALVLKKAGVGSTGVQVVVLSGTFGTAESIDLVRQSGTTAGVGTTHATTPLATDIGLAYRPTTDVQTSVDTTGTWTGGTPADGEGLAIVDGAETIGEGQFVSWASDVLVMKLVYIRSAITNTCTIVSTTGKSIAVDTVPNVSTAPGTLFARWNQEGEYRELGHARVTFTAQADAGQPARFSFQVQGQDGTHGEAARYTPSGQPTTTAPRLAGEAVFVDGLELPTKSFQFDLSGQVNVIPDANAPDGIKGAEIVGRGPTITLTVEQVTKAKVDWDAWKKAGTLIPLGLQIGTSAGNTVGIVARKAQVVSVANADADGIATRTVQLRLVSDSDAGDDELYLFHV